MNGLYLKLYAKYQELLSREEGQDLIEYALIAALLSVAGVAVLPALATSIGDLFTAIGGKLTVT